MADHVVTFTLSKEAYDHVRRLAEETSQSIEDVMIGILRDFTVPLPVLPPNEESELKALKSLSDDALWTIARAQMPKHLQTTMQTLTDKNSSGTITTDEFTELEGLVERKRRLTARKAEALALLTQRGYKLTPEDLAAGN
jgi:hypothetical protein